MLTSLPNSQATKATNECVVRSYVMDYQCMPGAHNKACSRKILIVRTYFAPIYFGFN